jgi:hypothetical protein
MHHFHYCTHQPVHLELDFDAITPLLVTVQVIFQRQIMCHRAELLAKQATTIYCMNKN